MRDVRMIGVKMSHVLLPRDNGTTELRDWDLWGPLVLCLLLSITLCLTAAEDQSALVFASVFVLVWCGAGLVTINALLLGGKISFFQSVSLLGYCICPLNIASIVCRVTSNKIAQSIIVGVAFVWACRASVSFMAQMVPVQRKMLGIYPVVLFYSIISWMILVQ
jgi:hypothetical protein